MRRALIVGVLVSVVGGLQPSTLGARAPDDRLAPQQEPEPRRAGARRAPESQKSPEAPQGDDQRGGAQDQRRAGPRPPAAPPTPQAAPRRPDPPPRVIPPRYDAGPRVYYFPPVSMQRGFYYHPHFGFYFGPYYGPYYPFPGPFAGPVRYSASAIRTRITPVDAQVFVNGYYAGVADDFNGVFQRLSVPAGEHTIEFALNGYRPYRQKIYVAAGDTLDLTHQMVPLGPGETAAAPESPRALPAEWTAGAENVGDRPASPFGVLVLRVEPADAQIVVDGDVWLGTAARTELTIHMPSGWHQLEVRKSGYQTFRTEIELSEGTTIRLNVQLVR